MATFTGTLGLDVANATTGVLTGFTGGTVAELQDGIGDVFLNVGGQSSIVGGGGDDAITFTVATSANQTINGGGGYDQVFVGSGGAGFITDWVNSSFTSIERFVFFSNTGTAGMFFRANLISTRSWDIYSFGQSVDFLRVDVGTFSGTTVDLSSLTFSNGWGSNNVISILANAGAQSIVGSVRDDSIFAATFGVISGNVSYDGRGGSDTLDYGSNPGVAGGKITVTINSGGGTIVKDGGAGTDTFSRIEKIAGTKLNDVFYADNSTAIDGDQGFDTFVALTGTVVLTTNVNLFDVEQVILAGGTNQVNLAGTSDFTYIYGGAAGSNNTMTSGNSGGYLISTGGLNNMYGRGGTNVFIGGVGTSQMHGGPGNNVYYIGANDTIFGAGVYSTVVALASNLTLAYGASSDVQQVILNAGTNSVDMTGTTDFVYLYGGLGTNTMRLGAGGGYNLSTGGVNHMYGGATGAGSNVFVGGVGTSDMHGGTGVNTYYAGANDTVFGAGTYNTLIQLSTGVTMTLGGAGLTNVQQFILNSGNNTLDGSSATTQLIIFGGANNDRVGGGTGSDVYHGGLGANTFVLKDNWGSDTIIDWAAGSGNRIDMTALAGLPGANAVHSMADLVISINGNNTTIVNGPDSLTLNNYIGGLSASNFIFA